MRHRDLDRRDLDHPNPDLPNPDLPDLDLSGLKCPLPVLRTAKALRGLAPGEGGELEIRSISLERVKSPSAKR